MKRSYFKRRSGEYNQLLLVTHKEKDTVKFFFGLFKKISRTIGVAFLNPEKYHKHVIGILFGSYKGCFNVYFKVIIAT